MSARWMLVTLAASVPSCVAYNADCPPASQAPLAYFQVGVDLSPLSLRGGESPMGNLVADAFYSHFRNYPDPTAQSVDLALVPAGIVHAGSACGGGERLGPGPVTSGELAGALPFSEDVVLVEASGQALVEALAAGVARVGDAGSLGLSESFPHVSRLRFRVDCTAPPASNDDPSSRINTAWLRLVSDTGEVPIDLEAKYQVATVAGVLEGNYAYAGLTKEIPVGGRRRDLLVVQDELALRSEGNDVISVGLEGRIQLVGCTQP